MVRKKKPTRELRPQEGFQEEALMCEADIAIIGGAAGGGKSWTLLAEPLRYIHDKHFAAVYFRRTMATIRATGGLWDESEKMYPMFGGAPKQSILKWCFPSGAHIDFEGIEYEKDLSNWQGTQIPLIIFDELTEFTKKMFFFMFSRNRGLCSIRPYIRASCNPDPTSWLREFIGWWIGEDGYPILSRSGVLRYMIVYKDDVIWGDTKDEVIMKCPEAFKDPRLLASGIDPSNLIKSVTFISGDIYNNKILLENDPGYLGSLNSMDEADQERFLRGNWNVSSDGLELFQNVKIDSLFSNKIDVNLPTLVGYDNNGKGVYVQYNDYRNSYITCDAARFGRDLCVIMVWKGWRVVHITVMCQSDPHDITREIEELRVKFSVIRLNVAVDQDGVGGDTVKLGRYYGFAARREVARDPDTKIKENYKMRKDQCYYRIAKRVNNNEIEIVLTDQTCKIYDKGAKNPRWSRMVKIGGSLISIEDLIKKQLRVIRRGQADFEGGALKLCVNEKEEQKIALGGMSPDFADTLMMREDFVLRTISTGKIKYS